MKKPLLLMIVLVFWTVINIDAQTRKYFSIGAGINQSTFYLQPGLFQKGELGVLFENSLSIAPEFNAQFNLDLDDHHTVAASLNVAIYRRVIAAALPVNLSYYYHFIESNNSPFFKVDVGYSFFLTNGAFYGLGAGYKYGKFRATIAYNNQLKSDSILENNEFITGRLGSLNLIFDYSIQRKKKGKGSNRKR